MYDTGDQNMFSLFIMYSTDRKEALDATISCLKRMDLYDSCQKTLVVDTKTDFFLPDWDLVEVPRVGTDFCWGRMWDAGVCTAKHEKIVYLDSDRLLPKCFLKNISESIDDDKFVFTSFHFQLLKEMPVEHCVEFLETMNDLGTFTDDKFMGNLKYEAKHQGPIHRPGKNVMSGSVGFTKKTYFRLGGVDHWYCGHGAYADTDFHYAAAVGGCQFVDLCLPELHWPHQKKKDGETLSQEQLWLMSLNNFIRYCVKWGLPLALAEDLAHRSKVKTPSKYVRERAEKLRQSPRDS